MSTSSVPLLGGKRPAWGEPVLLHNSCCNREYEHTMSQNFRVSTCHVLLLLLHCISIYTTQASAVLIKKSNILDQLCTHYFDIGFLVEGLSKDRDDKDIDEEGDEEGDSWLDEEVLVGFLDFFLIISVDFTRLVKEKMNRNSPNGLQQAQNNAHTAEFQVNSGGVTAKADLTVIWLFTRRIHIHSNMAIRTTMIRVYSYTVFFNWNCVHMLLTFTSAECK